MGIGIIHKVFTECQPPFLRPPYPTAASVIGGRGSKIDYEDEGTKVTPTQG
jgi:hypothetical protein